MDNKCFRCLQPIRPGQEVFRDVTNKKTARPKCRECYENDIRRACRGLTDDDDDYYNPDEDEETVSSRAYNGPEPDEPDENDRDE